MTKDNRERGHDLAYLIWDTKTKEDLEHLCDVFSSCMKIRREQLGIRENIRKRLGLDAEFCVIDDKIVDLKER